MPHSTPFTPIAPPGLHTLQLGDGRTLALLRPDWPAPPWVQALFTTRQGGCSPAPWDGWNLGEHVGDAPARVAANRALLQRAMTAQDARAPQPVFVQQVHGCDVLPLDALPPAGPGRNGPDSDAAVGQQTAPLVADAALASQPGLACTMLVADCLPVLLAHRQARVVAAIHAGWRGLAGQNGQGVLEHSLAQFAQAVQRRCGLPAAQAARDTLAWLGPCIGPAAFEVGAEVRLAFLAGLPASAHAAATRCFAAPSPALAPAPSAAQASPAPGTADPMRWYANLPALARLRLQALGVEAIYGNDGSAPWCTLGNARWFFSHRRDARRLGSSGRMAACIWIDETQALPQ
ncbi:laccase domain-containing protein [Vandammella animalimorsus]|uniref:Laccase domain-containing protein n=1 Tax=Vandammella animalimorsus TaxID=2029117 RepID=A0A3M6RJU4_9BURK|nr:polyphenol oxidase family protein [Vandammella animalimorsus]RMX15631.1 laccase domain-containing protein [Vandammella animalimorsus]